MRYLVAGAARQSRFRSGSQWRGSAVVLRNRDCMKGHHAGSARPGRVAGAAGSVRAVAGRAVVAGGAGLKSGSRTVTAGGLLLAADSTAVYLPEHWMIS